ncbi:MAG: hypothetical protein NVSMB29_13150 [Candidatus Dormibacteria bacterium]
MSEHDARPEGWWSPPSRPWSPPPPAEANGLSEPPVQAPPVPAGQNAAAPLFAGHQPWTPQPPAGPFLAPPADTGFEGQRQAPPGWGVPPRDDGPSQGQRRGVVGTLGAIGLFLAKYGFVLLKFGKLAPTAISMIIAVGVYTLFYGWKFAVGIVVLIFIHEMGHVVLGRFLGIPVSLPIFLGPFGAVTTFKRPLTDLREEAITAIGGPVLGTLAALGCALLGASTTGYFHGLLFALAYIGFAINLFNLLPINPLDGGRVANAVSVWANIVGLGIAGVLLLITLATGATNPFLIVILLIGSFSTYKRFKARRRGEGPPMLPGATRLTIGVAYVAMLAVTSIGMGLTHALR